LSFAELGESEDHNDTFQQTGLMTALMAYDIISEIVLRCIAVLTNSHHTLNFYHHQACDVHLPEPDPALCV
jgi:hypothetical protein